VKKSNSIESGLRKSKRGGARPGAGRPIGSRTKPDLYAGCVAALADALDGQNQSQFVAAMMVLGASPDATREALQLTRDQFTAKWGGFVMDVSQRLQDG
jgi:hypothetical protein